MLNKLNMVILVSMQSLKEKLKNARKMREVVKQAKPFNRLLDYGFSANELLNIETAKNNVVDDLKEKLKGTKKILEKVEENYKNGFYDREEYLDKKKEAKEKVEVFNKKIKNIDIEICEMILDKASNRINSETESKMSSKFLSTDFVESKAKELIPLMKSEKDYKEKWREILKKESHQFPVELKAEIKALEEKRQAIFDLLAYYGVTKGDSIKKIKNSMLYNMLRNIDAHYKESQKRLKDPEYDLKIRVEEVTTNQATNEILTARKKVMEERQRRKKLVQDIKESVNKGDVSLKENLEKREKELNLLLIAPPKDDAKIFTPSTSLLFRAMNVESRNPLFLPRPKATSTSTQEEEFKNKRKSFHY